MAVECWVDTNVILRFLSQDNHDHINQAVQLMEQVDEGSLSLHIHPLIVAECCYVLTGKFYKLNHIDTAELLTKFIQADGIHVSQPALVIKALFLFGEHRIDFEDAYLAVYSSKYFPDSLVTFNAKDFQKIKAEYYTPQELLDSIRKSQ